MKQHITPNQSREITEEEFYSLFDEIVYRKDWYKFHHKKMNIGKMIEILSSNINGISFGINESGYDLYLYSNKNISSKNLCGALWEAVKLHIKEDIRK